jgi:hypothetical protein
VKRAGQEKLLIDLCGRTHLAKHVCASAEESDHPVFDFPPSSKLSREGEGATRGRDFLRGQRAPRMLDRRVPTPTRRGGRNSAQSACEHPPANPGTPSASQMPIAPPSIKPSPPAGVASTRDPNACGQHLGAGPCGAALSDAGIAIVWTNGLASHSPGSASIACTF